jgi:SAM-dependent methyltransferase
MTAKTEYVASDRGYLPPVAQKDLFELPGRREFLVSSLPRPPLRVLDVGCAGGQVAVLLTRLGYEVTGIELNHRMAAEARRRGIQVLEQDLEDPLPFETGSFGAVHACEIIEHLFDTEAFLRELHRVLQPGGILVASTPNVNSLVNRWRVLTGRHLPMWGAYPGDVHGGHIRVFNKTKLVELLRRAGFEPQAFGGVNLGRLSRLLSRYPTLSHLILVKARRSG